MFDLRPVGYVIGLLVAALGATMAIPMFVDLLDGSPNWAAFFEAGVLTIVIGGFTALACSNGVSERLSLQQTFLLTTGVWLMLPVFAAIPFVFGATESRLVDAFFEAMSGMTTTGSTVLSGLDDLPRGMLVWRSMLQWFGGVGIIVVAMVFLPELRVGGMQIFRTEAFDTDGKVLPRAAQIASRISIVYASLTLACMLSYMTVGLDGWEAFNHALTTMATGGFSTHDASFGAFQGPAEYVAAVFMVLASLPFVRYVQMLTGNAKPILRDSQVRLYLLVNFLLILVLASYRILANEDHIEESFREAAFNVTSIITGTGFASVDYQLWGAFPVVMFFFLGLVGGCAGSTSCSVKIFRYQLLFSSIRAQIRKIHSPHGMFVPRYDGRPVGEEVLSSVMAFFVMFIVSIGVLALLLSATGLDFITSISGAATALANVGPGLGDTIGPAGNFAPLNDTAKWMLAAGMLIGRLELMAVYAILTVKFWRA